MKGQNDFIFDFEPFRIDTLKRQLSCNGEVLPITSKAFDTLLFLIRRRGETVSKNELIDAIWFDTAVEENNLTQQISTLRKALGDNARSPKFIITIPGQGYSFIAPVKENLQSFSEPIPKEIERENLAADFDETDNATAKRKIGMIKSPNFSRQFQTYAALFIVLFLAVFFFSSSNLINYLDSKRSICVLPFKSLDNNEKSNLYSAGIPSYVTAKIGNLPEMIVRPTNLSGQYYGQEQNVVEIGRSNNVDTVLTGSTLCDGDTVQVTVHLWDVKNNRQIWAKIFTRKASDAVSAQDAISEEIISALRNEMTN